MAIEPICSKCGKPLMEPGGILLGPPDEDDMVKKDHLCVSCYGIVAGPLDAATHTGAGSTEQPATAPDS